MKKYFLVPMNFLTCDFKRLREEYFRNKKIMWQIPGKKTLDVKKGMAASIEKGDIIYFYVCHIPSSSGNEKSRIMLRGEVFEEPTVVSYSDVFISESDDELVKAFSISNLTTLNKSELENDFCYCKEELYTKYGQIYPQGKRWPNSGIGNLKDGLISDLEISFKETEYKRDFDTLIRHFNQECFFKGKIGTKSDHHTFMRRNGTDYFEYHHFIQQHSKVKSEDLLNIIYKQENLICLCSNCHNKLHYGRPEEISKMIDKIWEDKDVYSMLVDNNFQDIIQQKTEEDAKNWIKEVYKSNLDKLERENDNI